MAQIYQHLRVNDLTKAVVVEFADRKILEELSIVQVGDELAQLPEAYPSRILIMGFGNVDHLSSAILGLLIKLREQVARSKGHLILADIRPQIYEVFRITKLNRLFDISESVGEALDRVTRKP
jgi:anti-sigma B factor antagonist